eukprot:TRINITY_DN2055_c0_g1_i3.p1 TRINITY_DN2055_c0_g1~~TRINITY_DN2055_c0_g1_i3.p1  ORF type:complete len:177 (+),score=34.68 TRINITY_DN2055_c0_g1_i3:36-566(+)
MWAALSLWEKMKFVVHLLRDTPTVNREMIESLKNVNKLDELVRETAREFPSLLAPLVTERDAFLVASLRKCCRDARAIADETALHGPEDNLSDSETPHEHSDRVRPRVVAVVGFGHLSGIERLWEDRATIDGHALLAPPAPTHSLRQVALALTGAAAVLAFAAVRVGLFALSRLRR